MKWVKQESINLLKFALEVKFRDAPIRRWLSSQDYKFNLIYCLTFVNLVFPVHNTQPALPETVNVLLLIKSIKEPRKMFETCAKLSINFKTTLMNFVMITFYLNINKCIVFFYAVIPFFKYGFLSLPKVSFAIITVKTLTRIGIYRAE